MQSQVDPGAAAAPIFDLGRVQYAFPAPLVAFVVCSDMLAMALSNNVVVLIELSHSDQVIKIQIPKKPSELTVHKIFMDPSGMHVIVTSTQGENFYMSRPWKKFRALKSLKLVIESIAWNKAALLSSRGTTREMLIGGRNGTIYEALLDKDEDFLFRSQERYFQPVFSLPERHPITGIRFDIFPPSNPRRALVIVTTVSRIYQFVGPIEKDDVIGRFSPLFATYRDIAPSECTSCAHTLRVSDSSKRLTSYLALYSALSCVHTRRMRIKLLRCPQTSLG